MFKSQRMRFALAGVISALVLAFAMTSVAAASNGTGASAHHNKKFQKSLTKAQIIALIKQYAGTGPQGLQGLQGDKGAQGDIGPSTGPAGGVLTGNYPDPGLAAGSVDTGNFAAGAKAPSAADSDMLGGVLPSGFQTRVTGTCSSGNAIRAIAADGTVTCQTGNPGTVTSVGSGTGLTGGPITSSGSLAVDPTVVQNRVTGTCSAGEAVQAVAQDGTVTCQAATLGSGQTETGVFDTPGGTNTPNSFPIPLLNGLAFANTKGIKVGDPVPAQCDDGVAPAASAAHPEADNGFLCIFQVGGTAPAGGIFALKASDPTQSTPGTDTAGFLLVFGGADPEYWGTWAVTGA